MKVTKNLWNIKTETGQIVRQDLIVFQTVLSQFSLPFSYSQVAKRKTQMLVQW